MRTLSVDIGGSGIKAMVLDREGGPLTERQRMATPRPATPERVLAVVAELMRSRGEFDRISVGFPGVVIDGVTKTAPNLGTGWVDFPLAETVEKMSGRPVRVANDAGIQGLGVIEGKGTEMVLTFGTGMGTGLYIDGYYVPNIELAHHPFKKGKTYEQRVSQAERKRVGNRRWNRRVREVIAQVAPIFNYRKLYLGGGNAKWIDRAGLPENVTVVDNMAGLLGGIKLWK